MINLEIVSDDLLKIECGIIVVPIFYDIVPSKGSAGRIDWLMNNKISSFILSNRLSGAYNERGLICNSDKFVTDKILLIGMGKSTTFDTKRMINISSSIIDILKKIDVYDFSIELLGKGILKLAPEIVFENMVSGFVKKDDEKEMSIHIVEEEKTVREKLGKKAEEIIPQYQSLIKIA
jgi:hypothetical protein